MHDRDQFKKRGARAHTTSDALVDCPVCSDLHGGVECPDCEGGKVSPSRADVLRRMPDDSQKIG
jgi:hypothetical protein